MLRRNLDQDRYIKQQYQKSKVNETNIEIQSVFHIASLSKHIFNRSDLK